MNKYIIKFKDGQSFVIYAKTVEYGKGQVKFSDKNLMLVGVLKMDNIESIRVD